MIYAKLLVRDVNLFFWRVKDNCYGKKGSWKGFNIQRDWFLNTKSGKKIFLVEADSSVGEEALALAIDTKNDLSYQESS